MNDLMSFGLHRAWKDALVAKVRPSLNGPFSHIDVAGGTGDVAARVAKAGGPLTEVTVVDVNGDMLRVGEKRAAKRLYVRRLRFTRATPRRCRSQMDASTPTRLRSASACAADQDALKEAYRVLRRGGFLCLELSRVDLPVIDRVYDAYSFAAIPAIGKVVTGDGDVYRYLVNSIRNFPPGAICGDDPHGRVRARRLHPPERGDRRDPLGLEA